jgi:hypothetical protein
MGPCLFYNKRMTMSASSHLPPPSPLGRLADGLGYHFGPDDDPIDPTRRSARPRQPTSPHEELPYKVELWDESRSSVEQVLAVTANGSIGYAAYYAATREYPDRYVTLRHKNNIISRSNPPQH